MSSERMTVWTCIGWTCNRWTNRTFGVLYRRNDDWDEDKESSENPKLSSDADGPSPSSNTPSKFTWHADLGTRNNDWSTERGEKESAPLVGWRYLLKIFLTGSACYQSALEFTAIICKDSRVCLIRVSYRVNLFKYWSR